MMERRIWWIYFICVFSVSGCAVHAPMSELVMMPQSPKAADGFGITVGGALPVSVVQRTFVTEANAVIVRAPLVPHQLNVTLSSTSYKSSQSALSISFGFMTAGVDYTYRLTNNNYLTVGFSGPAMYQGFVHQKILQGRNNALILSAGVRRERFSYPAIEAGPVDLAITHIPSIGLKLHGMFLSKLPPKNGARLQFYAGYMPKVDQAVFDVSVSFGRFWRNRTK